MITKMLKDINRELALTRLTMDKDSISNKVLAALTQIPRHLFVPSQCQIYAYDNRPLPIGYDQTISQPFMVALMTDLITPQKHHSVLEVGTGSGYQSAVLCQLVAQVYSMERITELASQAKQRLKELGYHNIHIAAKDGSQGWPQVSPFDGIIVTAAASHIPQALIEQLKPGGKLVIPVGEPDCLQELILVEKTTVSHWVTTDLLTVIFVPLISGETNS